VSECNRNMVGAAGMAVNMAVLAGHELYLQRQGRPVANCISTLRHSEFPGDPSTQY
jgi:hypothetical protein